MRVIENIYQTGRFFIVTFILCLTIFFNSLSLAQTLTPLNLENKLQLNLKKILAVESIADNSPLQLISGFSGQIYILDQDGNRVLKLSSEGKVMAEIGGFGFGVGQFNHPVAMVSPDDGLSLYVLDSENKRIVFLNSELKWIDQIEISQVVNDRTIGHLDGLAINSNRDFFISDPQNFRVMKLDTEGRFLSELTGQGRILIPGCLAIDDTDRLYLCDQRTNSILIYDELERFVETLELKQLKATDRIIVSDRFLIINDYKQNLSVVFSKTYKYLGVLSDSINNKEVVFNSLFFGQNSHLNVYEPHLNRIIIYDLVEK